MNCSTKWNRSSLKKLEAQKLLERMTILINIAYPHIILTLFTHILYWVCKFKLQCKPKSLHYPNLFIKKDKMFDEADHHFLFKSLFTSMLGNRSNFLLGQNNFKNNSHKMGGLKHNLLAWWIHYISIKRFRVGVRDSKINAFAASGGKDCWIQCFSSQYANQSENFLIIWLTLVKLSSLFGAVAWLNGLFGLSYCI